MMEKYKKICDENAMQYIGTRNYYILRTAFAKWFEIIPQLKEENYLNN